MDELVLSLHAPVTGAAPLPATTFERSRDLYWRWLTQIERQKVLGRSSVTVTFRDDRYEPAAARQSCRELASEAFLLVGLGGSDQIQACAQYANVANVPYLSVGVTESGMREAPWYFALSMSYPQQAPLLAQYVAREYPGKRVAAIVTATANFDDAVTAWEAAVEREGLAYHRTLRHPKGDSSWYNTFARDLSAAGVEVLFVLSSPVDYIRFAQQASQQGYRPQFVGLGVTKALNAVLDAGCPQVDRGRFFSPFPGLDWARVHQPEFFDAGARFRAPTDDIALGLWGIARHQHALFERYRQHVGTDLTREGFRTVTEHQRDVHTGVFPDLSYSPDDHFGARQIHVLEADCSSREHRTLASFVGSFG